MNELYRHTLADLSVSYLSSYFQPLVNLRSGAVIGCEALLRPVLTDTSLLSPAILFAEAETRGCLLELERDARDTALHAFRKELPKLPRELLLFINFSSRLLDHAGLDPGRILASVEDAGVPPERVSLEIVESAVELTSELQRFAVRNRDNGFLITLDDFGTEHSNLERVALVRPDIIKIDRSIVSSVSTDPLKRSVLRSIVYLAQTIGAMSLAEGLEDYQDLLVCTREGVQLGQGFLLGRPAPSVQAMLQKQSQNAPGMMEQLRSDLADSLLRARRQRQELEEQVDSLIASLPTVPLEDVSGKLQEWIAAVDQVECVYLLDGGGIQVTETIFASGPPVKQDHPLFRPSVSGESHRLKEYCYGPDALDQRQYLTDPYLSRATGRICRTMTREFSLADQDNLTFCVDIPQN